MFDSIGKLLVNTVKIVAAPIEIAAEITNAAVKPVADLAQEAVEEVKDICDDKR